MRTIGLLACTFLFGCAATASYVYAPKGATTWDDGYRAVVIDGARGSVELASFGLTELTADEVGPVQTLHVRMVVTNRRDDAGWCVDLTGARLVIPGDGAAGPLFVNAGTTTAPLAWIDRGQRSVFDLYYALPPNISDEDDLPGFDVAWSVSTPTGAFAGRTRFDRQDEVTPADTTVTFAAGWGPVWWSDPRYAWPIFRHESGVIAPRPPARVHVSRPPRWHARAVADHAR
jgi:hypothetical protein